ncbi:MAG: 50S ribosomal protein L4 [bacterium]
MAQVKLYNQKAESIGEETLNDKVFAVKIKEDLVHQAMVTQMANERKVLAHTKDRSEVRGGGKKPWKQKGTGRARSGSSRSPIWIGGGVTFGPQKDRNFTMKMNKKMKQAALCMALSDKLASNCLVILDKIELPEFKTRAFSTVVRSIETNVLNLEKKSKRSVLVILSAKQDTAFISGRNLVGVEVVNIDNINIVDILKYRNVILTVDGVKKLEKTYVK